MRRKLLSYFSELFVVILSLIVIVPLYMMVINSFKNKAESAEMSLALPKHWQVIENYREMFKVGGVLTGFKNSIIITVTCVLLIVVLCSMTAFILQRRKSGLSRTLYILIVLGLIVPVQIIPAFFICKFLHLSSYGAAIIMLITSNFSFGTFLYMGFYKSIPMDIDESAIMDGAGPMRLFFIIIFPLLKPVTVTMVIISFMNVWNDFGTTIYFLNSSKNYTLTLTIFNFFGTHNSDWNLVFANVVTVSLPVVILYFSLQKYIVSGMTAGSVKG